jgi:cyclic-di-AMP phosphodiesterase PgpH
MTPYFRSFFNKHERSPTRSRHLREKRDAAKTVFLLTSKRLTSLIIFVSCLIIGLVSFWGQAPSSPRISVDQLARVQVAAEVPFTYTSRIQTERERDRARKQIAPIYAIQYERFSEFEVFINDLNDMILEFSRQNRDLPRVQQESRLEEALNETIARSGFTVDVNAILTLYRVTDFRGRYRLLQQGLTELWHVYREGIFAPPTESLRPSDRFSFIKIADETGETREVQIKSPTEALIELRVRLSRLENTEIIYQSLFEIMKEGIVVNLYYNETEHTREINAAVEQVKPVEISVNRGETIIELGSIVTPRDMEKFNAYEERRREEAKSTAIFGTFMQEKAFYLLLLLAITILFIHTTYPQRERTNNHYLLCALMLTINMVAIRMVLELGETSLFADTNTFASLLLYAPPFLLAPLVINLLLGAIPGILATLLISTLYAMMQGDSIDVFAVVMLSGMVGIALSQRVRVRSKIVRASFLQVPSWLRQCLSRATSTWRASPSYCSARSSPFCSHWFTACSSSASSPSSRPFSRYPPTSPCSNSPISTIPCSGACRWRHPAPITTPSW